MAHDREGGSCVCCIGIFRVVDSLISNPSRPTEVSNINFGGYVTGVVVNSNLAFVADVGSYYAQDTTQGLWVVDISTMFTIRGR